MNTRQNFTHIIVSVPFQRPGNVVTNKMIVFRVQQKKKQYIATPFISQEERRLTNLPQEMFFEFRNQILTSSRGSDEGNTDVLKDIVQALKIKSFVM
ncbi:MAG TPA: hypothetical protein VD794_09835 [Flavisolibacter sp.]|nr:hypothetical protein [Flavisolibacter sp.]